MSYVSSICGYKSLDLLILHYIEIVYSNLNLKGSSTDNYIFLHFDYNLISFIFDFKITPLSSTIIRTFNILTLHDITHLSRTLA